MHDSFALPEGTPTLAESFARQAGLNIVGPLVAALVGGLLVQWILKRMDSSRAERNRNSQLSLAAMELAYTFYTQLIETVRVEEYEGRVELGDLPLKYEKFKIDARVLEEQLRVSFPDGQARWLWHGVVDMLSVRYYKLAHGGARLEGMIRTHGEHPEDAEIPAAVRGYFLDHQQLDPTDVKVFHRTVMTKFEELLGYTINKISYGSIAPPKASPVVLVPGRGSIFREIGT